MGDARPACPIQLKRTGIPEKLTREDLIMRHVKQTTIVVVAWLSCGWIFCGESPNAFAAEQTTSASEAAAQPQFNVEKQRQKAEDQAKKTLDAEAVDAIKETRKAKKAIADNEAETALAALERATGKINILVARNPATALIPVDLKVEAIEAAPADIQAIKDRARAAERAVANKDYPTARLLLGGLTSEIRVRTVNLPLASYPAALKEAARLLDQKKTREAVAVLTLALNTLVIIDQVTPIPIALADAAIEAAQALRDKDRERALSLLTGAQAQLERAKELGYAGNDPEYGSLAKAISDLEEQLKEKRDTASAFSSLKQTVASFFKRQSESEKR
jgi:hypothetical protein